MDKAKAEILAEKLDSLNKYFDITENTIIEVSEHINVDNEEPEIIEEDESIELLNINILKKDFKMIRETLIETISNGRKVINSLTLNISDLEVSNGQILSAYAELVSVVNNSLKLLTSTYKDILTIQNTINDNSNKNGKNKVDINNSIIFGGNMTDIIKKIQKG